MQTCEPQDKTGRQWTAQQLRALAEPDYRDFYIRLVPGLDNMLGVRMPALRRLARTLVRGDWRAWLDDPAPDRWYEETVLRGILTASAPMPQDERARRLAAFVPQIDNWAVCDCVCASLRAPDRVWLWDFLQPYVHSAEEFPARFAAVMLLTHFVTADDLARTLDALAAIPAAGYHARMGVAWAVSVCGVRFPAQTLAFLQTGALDDWTHNKSLQKMLESRRLPDALRAQVRGRKRRTPRGT